MPIGNLVLRVLPLLGFSFIAVASQPVTVDDTIAGIPHRCIKAAESKTKYFACLMDDKWVYLGGGDDLLIHFHFDGKNDWLQFNDLKGKSSTVYRVKFNCDNLSITIFSQTTFADLMLRGNVTQTWDGQDGEKTTHPIPGSVLHEFTYGLCRK